jgi:hypothetical protein
VQDNDRRGCNYRSRRQEMIVEKRSLFKEIVFWVILSATAFAGIYFFALASWPYVPARVESIIPEKQSVCRGGELCFVWKGEKFYDMPVNILVELVDGERYAVMSYSSNTPKGSVFRKRCFLVPYHVKPGTYRIQWTGTYPMNAFNTVHLKAISNDIEITNHVVPVRVEKGDVGRTGDRGERGERGGVNLFGVGPKGERGERGEQGTPGKDLTK